LLLPPKSIVPLLLLYLKKDLDLVKQRTKLFILEPAEFCDDCKELCLRCDDEWLSIWVLINVSENKCA
jgi:hypothetical protein